MILLDDVKSNDEFDIESFPFLKSDSFNFEKNNLFLPFTHSQLPNLNQDNIDFKEIKNIAEDEFEKSINIEDNLNLVDIQSTGSTKIFSSLKDRIIANQEKNINKNQKLTLKLNFIIKEEERNLIKILLTKNATFQMILIMF